MDTLNRKRLTYSVLFFLTIGENFGYFFAQEHWSNFDLAFLKLTKSCMILNERIESQKLLKAVNMLKVIAHPVRLAIVDLLSENPRMTVLEIQTQLNLEQAIASQQITLLEDKGVLISEKIGRNKLVLLT